MANQQNMTAEEFTNSVAEAIAAQLKIDASALVTRLVDSLSKGLIKEFTKKGPLLAEKSKPSETAKQKAEAPKLPRIEVSLPKLLENQFSKLDDISKSLNKLANKKEVVIDNKVQKSSESSFGVLGSALQKIIGSFRAPSQPTTKAPEIIKPLVEVVTKEAPKTTSANPPKAAEAPKSLLEQKVEAQPVIIAGISESGLKDLSEHLPDIIKEGMKDLIENLKEKEEAKKKKEGGGFEFPGMGIIGGALGVLSTIGGLFTLLYGLQTDGPFKGLAKLVGKGMLAIGDALTKPLQNFIKSVGLMLIDIPINMIKSAGETLSKQFKTFSEVATKIGSSKFIAPLKDFAEGIAEKLLSVPLKMLSSFKSSLGDLFGKVGGEAVKTGLGKLTGFLPKFMGGLAKVFSKIPIVGSLISIAFAVSRFKSGDYVGGGLDILSGLAAMIPGIGTGVAIAIDALNAFLDFKAGGIGEGKKGKGAMIMDWVGGMVKWVGQKLYKVITFLPIVGPALKSVEALTQGKWLEALKQFAYINPAFEFLGAMLGDKSTSGTMRVTAGVATNVMNWVGEIGAWISEKLTNIPMIGPLIKAGKYFFAKEWLKGLKQLAYMSPAFEFIGAMLGDTETSATMQSAADGAKSLGGSIKDWASGLMDAALKKLSAAFGWVGKIGTAIADEKWGEAFVEIGKIIPGMNWLVGMFGGEEAVVEAGNAAGEKAVDLLTKAKDFVLEKINKALGWIGKIGDAIKSDRLGEAFVEIGKRIPGLSWVINLMGEEKVAEVGNAAGEKAFDIFKSIKEGLLEKLKPVFGRFIDIGKKFESNDTLGGIAELCKTIPGLGWLGSILDSEATKAEFKENTESGNVFKSITDVFQDVSKSIMEMFLNNALSLIPPTILGFPLRALVAQKLNLPIPPGTPTKLDNSYLGAASGIAAMTGYDEKAFDKPAPEQSQQQTAEASQTTSGETQVQPLPTGTVVEPTVEAKPADAAIDPSGGLIVSSPTEGSLFQLSKNDGVIAAPVVDDSSNPGGASSIASTAANIGNSDKLLSMLVTNSDIANKNLAGLANGFNVLAKSLEKLGVSVANQSPTVINNVSGGSKGGSSKISSSQIASAGNSAISSFRSGIEASRFVPA